jgi:NarL family two-component system sensor histidine kinase YdfH
LKKGNQESKIPYEWDQLPEARTPVFIWIILTHIATITLQTVSEPLLLNSLIFTVLIIIHFLLYSFIGKVKWMKPWIYIVIQGGIILLCGFTMPHGFPATFVGLYTLLIGQSVGLYYRASKVFMVSIFSILSMSFMTVLLEQSHALFTYLIIMIPMTVSVVGYSVMLFRQVYAKRELEASLRELEMVHEEVEQLTIANERQRMARDLHDTLAQGLAGLIMQLEAINAHLNSGNIKRGQEVVHQAMGRVREALADARSAIDDLRSHGSEKRNLTESICDEVNRFREATGVPCELQIPSILSLPTLLTEHCHHIVSESLINIARHARAECVSVKVEKGADNILYLEIRDDGIGFMQEEINNKTGHYGLLGMRERVRILKGELIIQSQPQKGTVIKIEIPIGTGELR